MENQYWLTDTGEFTQKLKSFECFGVWDRHNSLI